MTLRIALADPRDPALADLIARHAAHSAAHYPSDSNHHLTGDEMRARGVVLFAARLDGRLVGMGGYGVIGPDCGEIKSMHVEEAARGQGVAAALLDAILVHARGRGVGRMFLETGSLEASAAARRLYERAGFRPCAPFGSYGPDPLSVFMTRPL